MIDTSTWKEFPLTALFDIKGSTTTPKNDLNLSSDGKYPYITTAATNNGIAGYSDKYTEDGKVITIDSAVLGTAFYQEDNFTASDHVEKLIPKFEINELIGQYLASVLNVSARFYQYAYNDKRSQTALKNEIIKLPATSDGQPDWDYMESYMKAVMEESEKSLENLRKADDTKHLIDVSGWGKFDVTKFFTVLSGRTKLSNADIDDGDTPVYSSNSINGGVFGYTTKSPDYEVNDENPFYITFGDHTKAVNIVDRSFCVMDNVKVLISNIRNYDVLHFIITSWLRNVPDLGYARHWSEAEKAKIWLPITSTGEPDWQYMEDYMRRIMDKSEQIISDLQIGA